VLFWQRDEGGGIDDDGLLGLVRRISSKEEDVDKYGATARLTPPSFAIGCGKCGDRLPGFGVFREEERERERRRLIDQCGFRD
jgi:hypothetical protein